MRSLLSTAAEVAGLVLIAVGIGMVAVWAGVIAAGVGLVAIGVFAGLGEK